MSHSFQKWPEQTRQSEPSRFQSLDSDELLLIELSRFCRFVMRAGGAAWQFLMELFAGIAIGLLAILGIGIGSLVGLAALTLVAIPGGLNPFGEWIERVTQNIHSEIVGFWNRFKSPQDVAWTFATITGTVGLILLMVHQSVGLTEIPKPSQVRETTHVARRPPTTTFAPPEEAAPASPDFQGELPNPFGPPPKSTIKPVEIIEPVEDEEPAAPKLVVAVDRTELPPDVARFNVPDSAEMFLVESARPELLDPSSLPADDWLQSLPGGEFDVTSIIPAAYRETPAPIDPVLTRPKPRPADDHFTTATRSIGVAIEKTQPTRARSGELIRYELIVTNQSEKQLSEVVVEERVAAPHRVAEAQPAAEYRDGVLTWRLDALDAGESRRLQVGVYPMSGDPLETDASVRSVATFSVATYVEQADPVPIVEPEPTFDATPEADVYRRIKITMTTPRLLKSGFACDVEFVVTNTGTVPLTGVVLRSVLPPELQHAQGDIVKMPIGSLAPGESHAATLHVTGNTLGSPNLMAEVSANEGVATTVRGSFQIVEQLVTQRQHFGSSCGQLFNALARR